MKSKYEVVEFRLIEKKNLRKHPAAELPMMADDKAALKGSIEERGIIQPLLVLADADKDGFFQVVDGCNRLDSAAADSALPCMLVRADDPRAVALECLATGRRRSTGQRIMVFLMMHKKEVLKAAEFGAEMNAGGAKLRFAVSRETAKISGIYADFTTDAIAERLQVSKPDVVRAVELFRCVEEKRRPNIGGAKGADERALDEGDEKDAETLADMGDIFRRVLSGGEAIRDWKRSFAGKSTTKGGRPPVDNAGLVRKGLIHLKNVFKSGGWHAMPANIRENLANQFVEVLKLLPEELRVRLPEAEVEE